MKNNMIKRIFLAGALAGMATTALAEDIDIYSQNTAITPGAPNVLLVLDNRGSTNASFSGYPSKLDATLAALQTVVNELKGQFNLGIAFYTQSDPLNVLTQPKGGYIRFAIQPMSDASGAATAQRNCLLYMVGLSTAACTLANTSYTQLSLSSDSGDAGQTSLILDEAYDYFAGLNSYAGAHIYKADKEAFVNGVSNVAAAQYKSPVEDGSCAKNFIIFINNDNINDGASAAATAMTHLAAAGGDTSIINYDGSHDTVNDNIASDEWTRFLNKSRLQVVTYALEVGPSTTGSGPRTTALLQSMGRQGKGGYFTAFDSASLSAALKRIFNDIQAVNSVFASSSLPLSADSTGNYANQVYMAVFRPDGSGLPRWLGNLKQYKFGVDSNQNLFLADADGVAAASSTSGFAASSARSFWTSQDTATAPDAVFAAATNATTGSTGGFWYFDAKGDGGSYDSPDGEWVEKGGAAQQLRLAYLGYGGRGGIGDTNGSILNSKSARQVYTCTGSCLTTGTALSSTPFDSSNTAITSDPTQFGIGAGAVTVSSISSDRSVATIDSWTGSAVATALTVQSLVATSTQVTVTTSSKHNLAVGNKVTIAGSSITGTNGTFVVVTAPSAGGGKTFTYAVSGVTAGTATGTMTATPAYTTARVTATSPFGFAVGTAVTISGASCPPAGVGAASVASCAFNGNYTIATYNVTSFTITLPSAVGASATGSPLASATIARVATAGSHGYSTGDSVTIANATCSPTACSGYNTTATIFNVQPTSFDYSYSAGAPLPVASNSGITSTNNTSSSASLALMLKWIRGQDTQNENGFQVASADTDVRASIHGDILHSRPVIINYAASGATTDNVYVFYGGNDGVFRAVKGGQAATDGKEQWAFIPKEFFPALKRQYDNSPAVLYPSTPSGLGATRRTYAWDGPVVSYVERDSSGAISKAYLYLSVRRGGRFIYALDVTSPTNPKFLWRKGCFTSGSTTTCDSGYAELGQTWSTPTVATVQASQANGHPVLIFGGGYDATSEDPEPPSLTDSTGRAVFVVDAFTGAVVWSAGNSANSPTVSVTGMNFSVAADVLALDRHQTGYIDRIYAADVGGNVWRIDTDGTSTASWSVHKLAALGNRTAASAGRKFLFGPEAVFGLPGTFDAVVIGSGDREHPLASNAANSTANRAYMLVDPDTGTTGHDQNIAESDLFDATNVANTVDLSAKKGWYVTLRTGEKVVNGPVVVASSMFFGTNQPCTSGKVDANGDCSSTGTLSCTGNLGIARRYAIDYLTAAPAGFTDSSSTTSRSEIAAGGGFLPSPVSGVVEINGSNYVFLTDNPLNPGGVINPNINVVSKRFRTYWHAIIE